MSKSDENENTRVQPPRSTGALERAAKPAEDSAAAGTTDDRTAFGKTRISPRAAEPAQPERTVSLPPLSPKGGAGLNAKPLPLETLKNRFVLEKVIGAGGMGVVYKAKDLLKVEAKDRDPYVAIKVLGEEFKSHPEAFIALQRESRKTQRIAHPNIVNVYDFDKDGDTVFMTMEFLEGTPLDKLIKKYRDTGLPVADAWQILEGICAALAYAHGQKIIHSDLKPGNIFVTHQNLAKVFDFGIARAVAKAEQDSGDTDDRTVFDAGNFGALTPAYASLEMLEGESPDVRDDIYALGCITYELLTGEHPFGRKNAKEAFRAGIKPARIANIRKHQWRVVERALAFQRANRITSVHEFWSELNKKTGSPLAVVTLVVSVLAAAIGGGYVYINREQPAPQPQLTADDFRSEIENEIRLELLQKNIADLLASKTFDERWENLLWEEMQNLQQLLGAEHMVVVEYRQRAYAIYVEHVQLLMQDRAYDQVVGVIERARRYTSETAELDAFAQAAQQALADMARAAQEQLEQDNLSRQKQLEEREKQQVVQQRQQEEEKRREEYAIALATVTGQLRCAQMIDMRDFGVAVKKLRSLDAAQYQKAEGKIVADLASCLQKIGRNFPDRAMVARAAALELFPGNSTLLALRMEQRDSCNESLAGFGARGRRSICQDIVGAGAKSPETVVIPAKDGLMAFAIGKYEVTIGEFNQFCRATGRCKESSANPALPVTGISHQAAREYLKWLSDESGKAYRLPTLAEWRLAAHADGRGLDANRNCRLNARGIQKGGALLNAEIGQQNAWGLVNHAGNAQEWVQDQGQLVAVGGSYATEMDECTLSSQQASDGSPDPEVGFRVVRELTKR